jgi:hypothetical protein
VLSGEWLSEGHRTNSPSLFGPGCPHALVDRVLSGAGRRFGRQSSQRSGIASVPTLQSFRCSGGFSSLAPFGPGLDYSHCPTVVITSVLVTYPPPSSNNRPVDSGDRHRTKVTPPFSLFRASKGLRLLSRKMMALCQHGEARGDKPERPPS